MPRKPKLPKEVSSLELVSPGPQFDGTLDSMSRIVSPDDESLAESRQRVVDLLRGEPDMAKFVAAWDGSSKRGLTLDEVAIRSGISKSVLMGAVTRVLSEWSMGTAKLIMSAVCARNIQPVTEAMIGSARMHIGGHADRKLFFTAMGQIGKPSGTTINLKAEANNSTVNAKKALVVNGRELPSFESGSKNMAAALRRLPAPAVE